MKKFTSAIIFFLFFVLIFFSSFTICYISAKTPSGKQKLQSEQLNFQPEVRSPSERKCIVSFLIKYQNGKLTLHKLSEGASPIILEEYEIDISLLPEEDRISLSEGISTSTFDEALQLIEDFSS